MSLLFVALVAAVPAPEAKPDPQLISQRTDTTVTQQHTQPAIGWNGAIVAAPAGASTTHTTQITARAPAVVATAPLVAAAPAVVSSPVVATSPYVHSSIVASPWYSGAYAYPYTSAWASPIVSSAHYTAPLVSSAYASPLVSSVYGYPAYSPYYSNYLLLKKKK